MAKPKPSKNEHLIADNRRARHQYQILETMETGIALTGTEVKSLRARQVQLREAFARIKDHEVWLHGMHIAHYEAGNRYNPPPRRVRKLLLHRREIDRLRGRVQEKGLTLIPLRLYFSERGWAKVTLGLARGRAQYDKRRTLAKREQERHVQQQLRLHQKR